MSSPSLWPWPCSVATPFLLPLVLQTLLSLFQLLLLGAPQNPQENIENLPASWPAQLREVVFEKEGAGRDRQGTEPGEEQREEVKERDGGQGWQWGGLSRVRTDVILQPEPWLGVSTKADPGSATDLLCELGLVVVSLWVSLARW